MQKCRCRGAAEVWRCCRGACAECRGGAEVLNRSMMRNSYAHHSHHVQEVTILRKQDCSVLRLRMVRRRVMDLCLA